jgi:large subunit ribosomal protein L9
MKVLSRARDAKRAKQDRAHADAEELAKRLSETTLVFKLKAGDQGKTFGSVTNKDIAEALQREHKVDVDKTKVHLLEPLKSLGVHVVEVRLLSDVRANVTVAIEPAR